MRATNGHAGHEGPCGPCRPRGPCGPWVASLHQLDSVSEVLSRSAGSGGRARREPPRAPEAHAPCGRRPALGAPEEQGLDVGRVRERHRPSLHAPPHASVERPSLGSRGIRVRLPSALASLHHRRLRPDGAVAQVREEVALAVEVLRAALIAPLRHRKKPPRCCAGWPGQTTDRPGPGRRCDRPRGEGFTWLR